MGATCWPTVSGRAFNPSPNCAGMYSHPAVLPDGKVIDDARSYE